MPIIRMKVSYPETLSGLGADLFVNTWHITTVAPASRDDAASGFQGDLAQFYDDIGALISPLGDELVTYQAYDLSDPEPRTPFFETQQNRSSSGGSVLPPEDCIVMSYRAFYGSGAPKARRRGRVFLGPIVVSALDATNGLWSAATIETVAGAGSDLLDAATVSTSYDWVVYSSVDDVGRLVTGGWVDDAVDTQRRRGLDLTVREPFGVGH